ncbi:MAG TPA: transaldolase family protein [Ktedonobacterales bacterium]|nr:transaldolase family protein [Ktedonobacterales bacterium]
MALYVDSAYAEEVAQIVAAYPVTGVTTNPTLRLTALERGQRLTEDDLLRELLRVTSGPVFVQPAAPDAEGLVAQATRLANLDSARVVIKLPANGHGLAAALPLGHAGVRFALTAVYALAQAYAGAMAGAEWLIPYFDRMRRSGLNPEQRLADTRNLLAGQALPANTRILAASLKSAEDVVQALLAGADDITAPPDVIRALAEDPLSQTAIARFDDDAARVRDRLGSGS